MNPLLDSEFLVKLNNDKNRTIYAHVISLNQYEHPIEQLEGVVTAGSITIDGQSAVRRVCSLTLSAKNLNINNVYWGLSTKVKIEIGLQNNINSQYDDIIWFPQGVFILTDFKTTQTVNNYTINLTGKDKMCLLNGDVSGNLPAPVRFDSYTDASQQGYDITASGFYNNFIDDIAAEAILSGFQERYGSDYQFIRGAKKILSIQYIPKENVQGTIKFDPFEEPVELSSIAVKGSDNKTYDINIGDKDIYGFIVEGCAQGDRFVWTIEQKIPIAIIIQEMLHQFGQERYSNIIIKDINPYALEMLDSAYSDDYYLLHNGTIYCNFISQSDLINNYTLYGVTSKNNANAIQKDRNGKISNLIFRNYVDEDDLSLIEVISGSTLEKEKIEPTVIIKKGDVNTKYTVQPVESKTVAGYGMTLLVYPDELIGQPGESITSILDKIVNMLGDYEYFYDLSGQFVFQAKPAYVKTAWNNTIYFNDENYVEASELYNRVAYTFDDSILTTQYQNTPNMNNIKNDYIIWGEKKNLSGNTIKFHGRYAIDNIPLEYTDFNGYTWTSNKKNSLIGAIVQKRDQSINSYQHIYEYPNGAMPEETGWWEVNDWANYYSTIFNINLSKNATQLRYYHEQYSDEDKNNSLNTFKEIFLNNYYGIKPSRYSDVYTLLYEDSNKQNISRVYIHGNCSHYYAQFMDLRLLDEGWGYRGSYDSLFMSPIFNARNTNKKFTLDNNKTQITMGYNPDYTTSFIYKPILPNNTEIYDDEETLSILFPDVKNENGQTRQYALDYDVDWRHLIHIMADDWYAHHTEDDYEINLRMNNSWPKLNIDLYPYGRTGYEQYYLDFTSIGGFWQDLYNINLIKYKYFLAHPAVQDNTWTFLQSQFDKQQCKKEKFGNIDTIKTINIQSIEKTDFNDYYIISISVPTETDKSILVDELKYLQDYVLEKSWETNGEEEAQSYLLICKISKDIIIDQVVTENHVSLIIDILNYDLSSSSYDVDPGELYAITTIFNNNKRFFNSGPYRYWIKDVIENPEKLNFWFDFFRADEMGIGKFAISVIGDRPKTINDSAIKTIIYRDTPDVIYCSWAEYNSYKKMKVLKDGYKYLILSDNKTYLADDIDDILSLPANDEKRLALEEELSQFPQNIKQNFVRSIRHKTVHDQADTMLYQYSYYNDTVNINNVPIYYLQPNTIISTKDELSKVTGYYIVNKINISLAYNGMMQITAIKSPERIY